MTEMMMMKMMKTMMMMKMMMMMMMMIIMIKIMTAVTTTTANDNDDDPGKTNDNSYDALCYHVISWFTQWQYHDCHSTMHSWYLASFFSKLPPPPPFNRKAALEKQYEKFLSFIVEYPCCRQKSHVIPTKWDTHKLSKALAPVLTYTVLAVTWRCLACDGACAHTASLASSSSHARAAVRNYQCMWCMDL